MKKENKSEAFKYIFNNNHSYAILCILLPNGNQAG